MTLSGFPPGLLLALGAFALPFVPARARPFVVLGLPLATLAWVWGLPDGAAAPHVLMDYEVVWVSSDTLGRMFAIIFSLMAFVGGLFALNQKSTLELVSAFVYAGCAVGVALAGDLISMFVFWEVMTLGSCTVILSAGGLRATAAALRYFLVHLLGGMLLLIGIVAHIAATGSIGLEGLRVDTLGGALILAGVLINAGAPPLSAWLADAYPEASFSGTVFLSAFTTKAAVYVLVRSFPGTEILIVVGLFMIFYGIVYALLENDMRRILVYSIVNQVGFMVTGVGIGTEMALNGVAAHAFAHIIYKALLLMAAGSVLLQTGKRKCSDLGGIFQSMPVTTVCGTIGALAISSFPFTSGFVSKSMITQAAGDLHLTMAWFLLMAASAGVFLHAGIKFPWFVFFQRDSGLRPPDPPWNMQLAMIVFAGLCVLLGVFPGPLYALLPFPVEYEPYTVPHVVNQLQLLLFSGLAFFLMLPLMKRTLTITLDFDWFYRTLGPRVGLGVVSRLIAVNEALGRVARGEGAGVMRGLHRVVDDHGEMAGRVGTSRMLVTVVVALGAVLVVAILMGP